MMQTMPRMSCDQVGCGEDPWIYRDFRGTWRVLCHGRTLPPDAHGFRAETSRAGKALARTRTALHTGGVWVGGKEGGVCVGGEGGGRSRV